MPATAANIPPELFSNIVRFIGPECNGRQEGYRWRDKDAKRALCSGALVCFPWAVQCRQILYGDRTVEISSRESALRFMALVTSERRRDKAGETGRLAPLHRLIEDVTVNCTLDAQSWIRLLAVPPMIDKLSTLILRGWEDWRSSDATGASLPYLRALLQSPHCPVPPSYPTPRSLTPYRIVQISNIQFGAFRDLARFFSHFTAAESVGAHRLTWPESTAVLPLPRPSRVKRRRPLTKIDSYKCTNDLLVCVQIASTDPDHALWQIEQKSNGNISADMVVHAICAASDMFTAVCEPMWYSLDGEGAHQIRRVRFCLYRYSTPYPFAGMTNSSCRLCTNQVYHRWLRFILHSTPLRRRRRHFVASKCKCRGPTSCNRICRS